LYFCFYVRSFDLTLECAGLPASGGAVGLRAVACDQGLTALWFTTKSFLRYFYIRSAEFKSGVTPHSERFALLIKKIQTRNSLISSILDA
jgi:hypothetical protein